MRFIAFISLAVSLTLLAGCRPSAAPVSVSDQPVSINDRPTTNMHMPPSKPLKQMSWTTLDGVPGKLGELEGKVVILDFWATYCPPCIEEIPHLNSLLAAHGPDKLAIVGLNVGGDEDLPKIPAFIERIKTDYPIAVPEDALSRFIFGNQSDIPQTAVFDKKGRLVKKIVGFSPEIQKELDAAVQSALDSE